MDRLEGSSWITIRETRGQLEGSSWMTLGLQKKPLIETEASTVRIYSTVNITSIYQVNQQQSDI